MLVLSRKVGERIVIGDRVVVTVVKQSGNRISLGIEAPEEICIRREELARRGVPPLTADLVGQMK